MSMKDFITGLYGTMYYVRDMNKAVSFYKDLYDQNPEDESPTWTTFKIGDTRICLHLAEKPDDCDGKGILIHNTKNLKASIPALKSMGVEIEVDYHQVCEGGYSVDVRDPSGNRLSLFEFTGV